MTSIFILPSPVQVPGPAGVFIYVDSRKDLEERARQGKARPLSTPETTRKPGSEKRKAKRKKGSTTHLLKNGMV